MVIIFNGYSEHFAHFIQKKNCPFWKHISILFLIQLAEFKDPFLYYMSKISCLSLNSNQPYENRQGLLDIQYLRQPLRRQ